MNYNKAAGNHRLQHATIYTAVIRSMRRNDEHLIAAAARRHHTSRTIPLALSPEECYQPRIGE
jgi:hypothetical protein